MPGGRITEVVHHPTVELRATEVAYRPNSVAGRTEVRLAATVESQSTEVPCASTCRFAPHRSDPRLSADHVAAEAVLMTNLPLGLPPEGATERPPLDRHHRGESIVGGYRTRGTEASRTERPRSIVSGLSTRALPEQRTFRLPRRQSFAGHC